MKVLKVKEMNYLPSTDYRMWDTRYNKVHIWVWKLLFIFQYGTE